jgi:precorrin-6Y C5,15-methyltransferase (decarboxylating)
VSAWLSIVGIGEDGLDAISPAARTLIDTAEVLVGSRRHLAMVPDGAERERKRVCWTLPGSPFAATLKQVVGMRGRRVAVLATGDPMHFGVGATLADRVPVDEMTILPSPSAFSLAASRLAWPLDRVTMLSVHGRAAELVAPHVAPGARLLVLANDAKTPVTVAAELVRRGFGESRLVALSHMGGGKEARVEDSAGAWAHSVPDFHTLAVECVAGPDAVWYPRVGLPDDAFRHDGKLTKREMRAAALAKLMPHPGALLVDIGTGNGSLSIEWMRAEPNARAIAIDPDPDRRAVAAHNAAALGVPHLDIRDGRAPAVLENLPPPDAIFIGGGISEVTIEAAAGKLKPGGRVVAHAVTLESESELLGAHARHGGELTRISVAHAEPVGSFFGWRPSMPLTQWAWRKI